MPSTAAFEIAPRKKRDVNALETVDPPGEARILLVQHAANHTGSTISGHLIADGMRQVGWDVDVVFGFDGTYRSRYEEIGCRTHVVPHKNWLRAKRFDRSLRCIAAEWRNAKAFERLIDEVQPDVVYINSLVSLAAAVAARRKQVPCVWHVRELFDDVGGEMHVPPIGGKTLVRAMLKRYSDARVALSQTVKDSVLDGLSNTAIVPNAVADAFFEVEQSKESAREQLSLPAGVPIVGVPATLRPVKGIEFFLDAAVRVHQSLPECRFAITGSGASEYETKLRERARQLGLDASIHWLGTVTDMPLFYRACDVICIPSRSESFGRTAIEAFACGTPLVASAVGGLREIVEDGVNGLLVEYGDVAGLAVRILALLGDETMRHRLASCGQQDARDKYSESQYQAVICDTVRRVIFPATSMRRLGAH